MAVVSHSAVCRNRPITPRLKQRRGRRDDGKMAYSLVTGLLRQTRGG